MDKEYHVNIPWSLLYRLGFENITICVTKTNIHWFKKRIYFIFSNYWKQFQIQTSNTRNRKSCLRLYILCYQTILRFRVGTIPLHHAIFLVNTTNRYINAQNMCGGIIVGVCVRECVGVSIYTCVRGCIDLYHIHSCMNIYIYLYTD